MKKNFKVNIASRYMYNEFREYNIYQVSAKSMESARNYAKRVISHWNKIDNTTNYEIYDIWEV